MKKRRTLLSKIFLIAITFCLIVPFISMPLINEVSYAAVSPYGSIEIEGMYTVVESDGTTIRMTQDVQGKGYIDYSLNYNQYHYVLTDTSMSGTNPIRLKSVDKVSNTQFVIHYTRKDGSSASRIVSFNYCDADGRFVSFREPYGELIDTDGIIYKAQLSPWGDVSLIKNGALVQTINVLTTKETNWLEQLVQRDFYVNGNQFMLDLYYEGGDGSHYNRSASIGAYTAPVYTNPLVISLLQTPDTPTNGNVMVKISTTGGTVISTKFAVGNQPLSYFENAGTVLTGNSFTVSENNTYTVYTKDNVGNKKIQTITISNIDKTPPANATFSIFPVNSTNERIRIFITYPIDARILEYSFNNVTWMEYKYNNDLVVTANGTVYARSKDAAGNISNVTSYQVKNIPPMQYDPSTGRLNYIQLPSGQKYKYIYDTNGNLLSIQLQ